MSMFNKQNKFSTKKAKKQSNFIDNIFKCNDYFNTVCSLFLKTRVQLISSEFVSKQNFYVIIV